MHSSTNEPEQLIRRLRKQALFSLTDDKALCDLVPCLEWLYLPGGRLLCREGDDGDSLYVLLTGRLRVSSQKNGVKKIIGEIGPGECVGEMALLTGDPRSATVKAIRDSELVVLDRSSFENLSRKHPQTMMEITRTIIRRYQSSLRERSVNSNSANFAVIPLTGDAGARNFAENLAVALGMRGTCEHLCRKHLEARMGRNIHDSGGGPAHDGPFLEMLHQYESALDWIVFECELRHETWTRTCMRHADRILLAATTDTEQEPLPDYIKTRLEDPEGPHVELVLIHPSHCGLPKDTARWLDLLQPDAHHHLRHDDEGDLKRLARSLVTGSVGLVLGGGGARGFAHIGVIRAFRDAGIEIDLAGGSSMGAIIAAQLAMGWDVDTMMKANRKAFVDGSLWDYTLPIMALTAGNRFERLGEEMFGDAQIEDLWLPYFCVSTSLSRAASRVHRRGLIRKWVRSSTAIPGLIPPVFVGGETLVDGAVLNNVPVDVMAGEGRGPICAVDITPRRDMALESTDHYHLTPWKVLWSKLNPFAETIKTPGLFNIILRTITLSSNAGVEAMERKASLYLKPPLDHISMLDWKSMDEAVEIGYRHASEQLAGWKL